jgi:hypothetical protein
MFTYSLVQRYCYQLMGPSSAENHSSHTDSAFRHQGRGVRGGNSSSFDTSATQIRGVEGDDSSSDLSMSSPPLPSTFDFVIKNAQGKREPTSVDCCCFSCYSRFFSDVEEMVGRMCSIMQVTACGVGCVMCAV